MRFSVSIFFIFFLASISAQTSDLNDEVNGFRAYHTQQMINYKNPPITKGQLKELSYYPTTDDWVINAELKTLDKPRYFTMKTSNGSRKTFVATSVAIWEKNNKSIQLYLFQRVAPNGKVMDPSRYFLPFTDGTSGVTTYGGGRYMDIPAAFISDGRVRLNFNLAYNPWCAYGGNYSCPIPPKENDIPVPIEAGELTYH